MKKTLKSLWKDRTLVLMTLPAVILLIMFSYIPMTGIVLAFKRFDFAHGLYDSPWCGWENFRFIFLTGESYWRMLRNTLLYYLAFTVLGTVCNVALAIAINELVFKKAGKYLQSVMILPTFISYVAVSYIVKALLDVNYGMINHAITAGGNPAINFYIRPEFWPFILIFTGLWKGTGYGSVIYLSALSGIDPSLYEAAEIDGATGWQKLRYITIPMLIPMVTIMTVLGIGSILHSDTGLFYQVTKNTGALYPTTQVLDSYILGSIMGANNFGITAATALYQSVIGCILIIVTNLIVKKFSPENSLF